MGKTKLKEKPGARMRGSDGGGVTNINIFLPRGFQFIYVIPSDRSQWPRGLRRRFAAACLLKLWVQVPPEGHGCLSVVSVEYYQVEVSATS